MFKIDIRDEFYTTKGEGHARPEVEEDCGQTTHDQHKDGDLRGGEECCQFNDCFSGRHFCLRVSYDAVFCAMQYPSRQHVVEIIGVAVQPTVGTKQP